MTMPSDRTTAPILAAEFLQELRWGTDTPDAIQAQAISVVSHFPAARSIEQEAKRQLRRQLRRHQGGMVVAGWCMAEVILRQIHPRHDGRYVELND